MLSTLKSESFRLDQSKVIFEGSECILDDLQEATLVVSSFRHVAFVAIGKTTGDSHYHHFKANQSILPNRTFTSSDEIIYLLL